MKRIVAFVLMVFAEILTSIKVAMGTEDKSSNDDQKDESRQEQPIVPSPPKQRNTVEEAWRAWQGPLPSDPIYIPSPEERIEGSEGHPSAGLINSLLLSDDVVFIPTSDNETFEPTDSSVNQLFKADVNGVVSFLGPTRAPTIELDDGNRYGIIARGSPQSFAKVGVNKLVSIGQTKSSSLNVVVSLYEVDSTNVTMRELDHHFLNNEDGPNLSVVSPMAYTIESLPDGGFVALAIGDTNFVQGSKVVKNGAVKVANSPSDAISFEVWKKDGSKTVTSIDFKQGQTANHLISAINSNPQLKQEGISANLIVATTGLNLRIKKKLSSLDLLDGSEQPRINVKPANDGGEAVLERFFSNASNISFSGGGRRTIVGQLFSIDENDRIVPRGTIEYPFLLKAYEQGETVTDSRADIRFIEARNVSENTLFVGVVVRNPKGDTELMSLPIIRSVDSLIAGKPSTIVDSSWGSDDPCVLSYSGTPLTITGATVAREANDEGIIFAAKLENSGDEAFFKSDFHVPNDLPHYRYSGVEHLGENVYMYLAEREFVIDEGEEIPDFHGWSIRGTLIVDTENDLPSADSVRQLFAFEKENGKTFRKLDGSWIRMTNYPTNEKQFETIGYIYTLNFEGAIPLISIINSQIVRSDDVNYHSNLAVAGSATITSMLEDGKVFVTFRSSSEKGYNNGAQIIHP